jgi:hypothetical protein
MPASQPARSLSVNLLTFLIDFFFAFDSKQKQKNKMEGIPDSQESPPFGWWEEIELENKRKKQKLSNENDEWFERFFDDCGGEKGWNSVLSEDEKIKNNPQWIE